MDNITLAAQFFLGVFAILFPLAVILACLLALGKLNRDYLKDIDFDPLDDENYEVYLHTRTGKYELVEKATVEPTNPLSKNFTHDCID